MERNKDKIIHIFQCESTLTPPGLTMSHKFFEWFTDWSYEHDYALLTYQSLKECKRHIPFELLAKAKYVFAHQGKEVYKYRGLKWMKKLEDIETYKDSSSIIDKLLEDYKAFYLYSHDCHKYDRTLRDRLHVLKGSQVFEIGEWKDTVLYMKRNVWEEQNA